MFGGCPCVLSLQDICLSFQLYTSLIYNILRDANRFPSIYRLLELNMTIYFDPVVLNQINQSDKTYRGTPFRLPSTPLPLCVCVLYIVLSSHLFWMSSLWTYQPGSHRRNTSAVFALIFLARRIQPFLSLVDREVEFCVPTNESFSACEEKSQLV